MINTVVATRYAEAFLQYAQEVIGRDQGVEQLLAFKQTLSDNPDFKAFLEDPEFSENEKFALIDKIIEGNFADEVGNFLKLLIVKERIGHLAAIIEYIRMKYGHGDMASAVLSSAFPLDDDLINLIKAKLEKKVQRRINLYVTFESELLGGFKIAMGNKVFDGSLKRQLSELRAQSVNWRTE